MYMKIETNAPHIRATHICVGAFAASSMYRPWWRPRGDASRVIAAIREKIERPCRFVGAKITIKELVPTRIFALEVTHLCVAVLSLLYGMECGGV